MRASDLRKSFLSLFFLFFLSQRLFFSFFFFSKSMENENTNPSSFAETTTVFSARDPAMKLLSVNMANITKLTNNN